MAVHGNGGAGVISDGQEVQMPSQDLFAERFCVAVMMLYRSAILKVLAITSEEQFYSEAHRLICRTIRELTEEGYPADDPVMIADRLATQGQLEAVGGVPYLHELMETQHDPAYCEYYADIVRRHFINRVREEQGNQIVKAARDPDGDVDAAIKKAFEFNIGGTGLSAAEFVDRHLKDDPPVIEGLARRCEVMGLVSASKAQKSYLVLLLSFCSLMGWKWLNSWCKKSRVLLIDTECTEQNLAYRINEVATALGIDKSEYSERFRVESLRAMPKDFNKLVSWLMINAQGFDLVIVDSLYKTYPDRFNENENGDMARLVSAFSRCASRLNCVIVIVHHSTKGNQSNKLAIDTGAGAGAFARAVDTLLAIRAHEDDWHFVFESTARSFAPTAPFVAKRVHPLWEVVEGADPTRLKQERPRRQADDPTKPTSEEKRRLKDEESDIAVLEVYELSEFGETESKAAARAKKNSTSFPPIHQRLLAAGFIARCMVPKGKTEFSGHAITQSGRECLESLRQLRQLRQSDPSDSDNSPTDCFRPFRGETSRSVGPTSDVDIEALVDGAFGLKGNRA